MHNVITVTCPICKGMLEIDVAMRQVVRHFERSEKVKKEDLFAKAVEKSRGRDVKSRETYDTVKENLRGPKRDLDELMKED